LCRPADWCLTGRGRRLGRDLAGCSTPPEGQAFTLVGTVIIVPRIIAYTDWSYRAFQQDKVSAQGYHRSWGACGRWQRLAWMAGIWQAGVLTLGLVAAFLRFWLRP